MEDARVKENVRLAEREKQRVRAAAAWACWAATA